MRDNQKNNNLTHIRKNYSNIPGNPENTDGLQEYEMWCGLNSSELNFNYVGHRGKVSLHGKGNFCEKCIIEVEKYLEDIKKAKIALKSGKNAWE